MAAVEQPGCDGVHHPERDREPQLAQGPRSWTRCVHVSVLPIRAPATDQERGSVRPGAVALRRLRAGRRPTSAEIRSPRPVRRLRPPLAGWWDRQPPARSVRGEGLHQGVSGDDHPGTAVLVEAAHRTPAAPSASPGRTRPGSWQVPADRQHNHIGWEAEADEGRAGNQSRARTAGSHADSLAGPSGHSQCNSAAHRKVRRTSLRPSLTRRSPAHANP